MCRVAPNEQKCEFEKAGLMHCAISCLCYEWRAFIKFVPVIGNFVEQRECEIFTPTKEDA